MKHSRTSITSRLTILFAAISTAVLLVLGFLITNVVDQHFIEQDMELLKGKIGLAGHLLGRIRSPADLASLPRQLDDSLVGHDGLAIIVQIQGGKRLYATPNAPIPEALLKPAAEGAKPQIWQHANQLWRGTAALLPTGSEDLPPMLVAVAVDIANHERFMHSFNRTLWLFIAGAIALVGFLGWMVVRRGLAPLQAMRQGAAGVTASRLDYRLSVGTVPVELVGLAETLNDMLARLEESFQRLKDFSSDLAHELRTPINNLMTQTQVALTRARSAEEYREVLASNAEEYERLARMIGDMLFLAQADNGLIVPQQAAVDLAEQVRELFDFFDALAEDKDLQLSLTGSAQVTGDKLMLRRALANLLSNAIRHTPKGGRIEVRIEKAGGHTKVAVENSGEPIPQEQLSRLFERFYRGAASRHSIGEGAGLGLAITRSIIRAHGGEIEARSGTQGVCFEIKMA